MQLADSLMLRARLPLLSVACLALVSGCNPFGCEVEWRSSDFEGRLGDSTVAVVADNPRTPGRVFVSLSQERGSSEQKQVGLSINYWSFADSVSLVRLTRFSDPARVPAITFSRDKGYAVRDTFFNLYPQLIDSKTSNALWDVFNNGDGMLEMVPMSGPVVRARMKKIQGNDFAPACT